MIMQFHESSINRFKENCGSFHVDIEYIPTTINYILYGLNPGSFFTSVFANDFMTAMLRSHEANTVTALKHLVTWVLNSAPPETFGSYDKVTAWCDMDDSERRKIVEQHGLVFTEHEELMIAMKT